MFPFKLLSALKKWASKLRLILKDLICRWQCLGYVLSSVVASTVQLMTPLVVEMWNGMTTHYI